MCDDLRNKSQISSQELNLVSSVARDFCLVNFAVGAETVGDDTDLIVDITIVVIS